MVVLAEDMNGHVESNTLFMKQKSKLVTYVAGLAKSTVDYIIVWQGDKSKVRNVKVIPNESVCQSTIC